MLAGVQKLGILEQCEQVEPWPYLRPAPVCPVQIVLTPDHGCRWLFAVFVFTEPAKAEYFIDD
jgi:hypothetical protein